VPPWAGGSLWTRSSIVPGSSSVLRLRRLEVGSGEADGEAEGEETTEAEGEDAIDGMGDDGSWGRDLRGRFAG